MSFYLQAATETADLIEHGEVQEGSAYSHSDFERLLGITEIKKKQLRALEEKRVLALQDLEDGRRRRSELREQMQHARNESIVDAARRKKEEDQQRQRQETLQDRLNAALAKKGVISSSSNNNQQQQNQANGGNSSVIKLSDDPFLRFRAEDERVRNDKTRVLSMKDVHGTSGSDLLRRFVEGASDWSTRKQNDDGLIGGYDGGSTSIISDDEKNRFLEHQRSSILTNHQSVSSLSTSASASASSSSLVKRAKAKELEVPTVANLVSHGYGSQKSKSLASKAVKENQTVENAFRSLDEKDKHDFMEWQHRRNFYDKERIGVLEQMKAEGFFRHSFSNSVVTGGDHQNNKKSNNDNNGILGHAVEDDVPSRTPHPIDNYCEAVRNTVEELHRAEETWKVVTANQIEEISALQRAANVASSSASSASNTTKQLNNNKSSEERVIERLNSIGSNSSLFRARK